MNNQNRVEVNGKSLAGVVSELKDDLTRFVQTRYQMLLAEMKQKLTAWKLALPMILLGALFGLVGFLMLTGALVYVISLGIGVGYSLLVVGVGYVIIAGFSGWMAYQEIRQQGMAPQRTMQVLKQDKVWLQNEARSA